MRVSVASDPDLVSAINPQYKYFTVKFILSCAQNAVISDYSWLSNASSSISLTYLIDSGNTQMPFQFTNSLSHCEYEIKVDKIIGGTWQSFPKSNPPNVYEPYAYPGNVVLKLDLVSNIVNIQTEIETKDNGYTREFKLTIGSPTVAEAGTAVAELFLSLDIHHPCRNAVLTAPLALSSMETFVNGPAVTQAIASV